MNRMSGWLVFFLACAACGGSAGHRGGAQEAGAGGRSAGNAGAETVDGGTAGVGGTRSVGGAPSELEAGSAGEALVEGALEVSQFQSSACTLTVTGGDNTDLPELLTGRDLEQHRGLQCVAWDTSHAERAVFDLINFDATCGFGDPALDLWAAAAQQGEDGLLRISVEWDSEDWLTCLACGHNFSFVIEDVTIDGPLAVEIATRSCTACGWSELTLEIPASDRPTGIVCRYLRESYVVDHDVDPSACPEYYGSPHRPSAGGQCDEGLVAVLLEPEWEICAAECSEEAPECPLPELLSCQQDVCRLSETW